MIRYLLMFRIDCCFYIITKTLMLINTKNGKHALQISPGFPPNRFFDGILYRARHPYIYEYNSRKSCGEGCFFKTRREEDGRWQPNI